MTAIAVGAVYLVLRFDVLAAPPVFFHGHHPERAPWVLVDRNPWSLDVGDVILFDDVEDEEHMAEICQMSAAEMTLHAPGYPPYAYTYEVDHDDVTGRVVRMFGAWE